MLRLYETENDLDVGMKGRCYNSELLVPLGRTVRNTKIHKFSSLNWKIFTVRRDGSIGTHLLSLALMEV